MGQGYCETILRTKSPSMRNFQRVIKNGNPVGWGIPSVRKTVQHIVSGVDRMFLSNVVFNGTPSAEAGVRMRFHSSAGTIIDHGHDVGTEEIKILGGRFIARTCSNIFGDSRQMLNSMTIPYSCSRDWESPLRTFLELGMAEKVFELKEFIESSEFRSFGFTLGMSAAQTNPYALLPGTYKHYTHENRFYRIRGQGIIGGTPKEERNISYKYVYLSQLTLRPKEASLIYWTEGERQTIENRAEYVISFNLKDNSPVVVDYNKGDPFVESWVRGDLPLDQVNVMYMGKNDPKYFFTRAN